MISEPRRHCTVELQALPSRIGQVRRIVSAHLRYWHLDALIDHAALGVTELLTNVHRHAQPDKMCTVEIELLLDRLTVSVHDHDPRIPDINGSRRSGHGDVDELATSGRGLAIIEAVSESWGIRPHGENGKVIWFTLPAPTPAVAVPSRSHAVYGATTDGPFAGHTRFGGAHGTGLEGVPFGTPAAPVRTPATAAAARSALAG
ncbi:ATP-binding protein [Streptomyces sp. ISL-36]|uniref:ATP-binding protein n=1 Tax=Streptomyces sp. ISL-36 TaxID=2819182 RepID=UPI001BE5751C|nr:ATP-binding protein [Streptomyces sp. ISL-36]MBT2442068.1 ATP-binding protein [Streptomyces sp. ISL-36]